MLRSEARMAGWLLFGAVVALVAALALEVRFHFADCFVPTVIVGVCIVGPLLSWYEQASEAVAQSEDTSSSWSGGSRQLRFMRTNKRPPNRTAGRGNTPGPRGEEW